MQCLFVEFERLLIVFLCVLHLTQNEAEVALQMFDFGSKLDGVCSIRSSLQLKHLLGSEAKLFALLEFSFKEEVFS